MIPSKVEPIFTHVNMHGFRWNFLASSLSRTQNSVMKIVECLSLKICRVRTLSTGLGRVPDLRVWVQVRVLAICVSSSPSPSTWLLHEYEYEYWLMSTSTSTSTSTGLWSTFFIACIGSRFLLFGAKIVQYHEMYGKWWVFFKVWSKNFHILTRSWMRDWTSTNDNNKHKLVLP